MKRLFIASFVAAAAVAYPAYAGAATVKGVVVGASAARGTIAVASTRGAVRTLHVAKLVRVGTRVTATAASRADGTFTASHVTVRGRVHRAHIHGVVTARRNGRFLLSAGKSMIVVRAKGARRALASVHDGPPPPGTTVDTTVDIGDNGELDEHATKADGNQAIVEIEGTVVAVTGSSFQVKTEGGLPLTINVPAGMTANVAVGDEVDLKADLQGATLTLVSLEGGDEQGDGSGSSGSGSSSSD